MPIDDLLISLVPTGWDFHNLQLKPAGWEVILTNGQDHVMAVGGSVEEAMALAYVDVETGNYWSVNGSGSVAPEVSLASLLPEKKQEPILRRL